MDIKECKSVEDYRDAAHFWQEKWDQETKELKLLLTSSELELLKEFVKLRDSTAALRREVEEGRERIAWLEQQREFEHQRAENALQESEAFSKETAAAKAHLAAMTKERDEADGSFSRAIQERNDAIAERATALARAEALEKVKARAVEALEHIYQEKWPNDGDVQKVAEDALAAIDATGGTEG